MNHADMLTDIEFRRTRREIAASAVDDADWLSSFVHAGGPAFLHHEAERRMRALNAALYELGQFKTS